MRHPRVIIAGIGLAAVAAVGGVTAASAGGSAASSAPSASPTAAAAAVRTAPATVAGRTETILVNAHGLPPVLLPARHGGEVVCHRKPGQPVAAADLGRAHRHRGKRQARRTQRRQRPPGHLQRPPAIHLRRRSRRPGHRPGHPELLRSHPRPYPTHHVLSGNGPGRPVRRRPRLLRPSADPARWPASLRAGPSGQGAPGLRPGPPVTLDRRGNRPGSIAPCGRSAGRAASDRRT